MLPCIHSTASVNSSGYRHSVEHIVPFFSIANILRRRPLSSMARTQQFLCKWPQCLCKGRSHQAHIQPRRLGEQKSSIAWALRSGKKTLVQITRLVGGPIARGAFAVWLDSRVSQSHWHRSSDLSSLALWGLHDYMFADLEASHTHLVDSIFAVSRSTFVQRR